MNDDVVELEKVKWVVIYKNVGLKETVAGWGKVIGINIKRNSLVIREEPVGNTVFCYISNAARYDSKEEARKKFKASYRA